MTIAAGDSASGASNGTYRTGEPLTVAATTDIWAR
jgi:hypothetical protein